MSLDYEWKKRMVRLPDFIDNMSEDDYWLWFYIRNISQAMLDLSFLKNPDVDTLIMECNKNLRYIEKTLDDDTKKFLLITNYVICFYEDLLNDLIESELYEGAANMKKLNDNFYVK